MSWDYTAYVRTRKKSLGSVRRAAAKVAASQDVVLLEPEDEEQEDELVLVPGGVVHVDQHTFGVSLSIWSTDGATAELGELVDLIAVNLGTVVSDEAEIAALIEQDEKARQAAAAKAARKRSPLADQTTLVLEGSDGAALGTTAISTYHFNDQRLPGGLLRTAGGPTHAAAFLSEAGRFPLRATRLVCTLHDERGKAYRRVSYELDGYGRVASFTEDELAPLR